MNCTGGKVDETHQQSLRLLVLHQSDSYNQRSYFAEEDIQLILIVGGVVSLTQVSSVVVKRPELTSCLQEGFWWVELAKGREHSS